MIKKIFTIGLFIVLPVLLVSLLTYNGVLFWNVKSFTVLSGSMEPKLPVGSMVITLPQDSYGVGDIVAFHRDNEIITHRIAKKEVTNNIFAFSTKGDANNAIDIKKITQDTIVGKEIIMIPFVGKVIGFIRTVPGFLLLIVLPSILFIAFELWDIKKELEKEIEKKIMARINRSKEINVWQEKTQHFI